jgi:replicative DNA helicase
VLNAPASPASHNGATPKTAAVADKPQLLRLDQLLDALEADAGAAHAARASGHPRGPVTGLGSVDRELGGFLQPGLHVLHSNTGVGKTAFAWQMATTARHPCLYVSCEMAPLELLRRLIARATDTHLGKLKSGELDAAESRRLAERAIATAAGGCYLVDATTAHAPGDYLLEVATIAKDQGGHLLIVVDSVHSWIESSPDMLSEYDALNAGLVALRQLAHALACPVLTLAERSRAAMKDGGVNAAAGSRRFEYGAESVISLDRKGAIDSTNGAVPIELVLDKNRHGASGRKIKLHFLGAVQRFEEAPP